MPLRILLDFARHQQVLASLISGLLLVVFGMAEVWLFYHVHARKGRLMVASPSARLLALEQGSRAEALPDA